MFFIAHYARFTGARGINRLIRYMPQTNYPSSPRRRGSSCYASLHSSELDSRLRGNDGEGSDHVATVEAMLKSIPVRHADYQTVSTLDQLNQWIANAADQGFCAFDTETDSLDAMQANIVGVSLATAPGKACYVPLAHQGAGDGLFSAGLTAGQIPREQALEKLKPLFENPDRKSVV